MLVLAKPRIWAKAVLRAAGVHEVLVALIHDVAFQEINLCLLDHKVGFPLVLAVVAKGGD